jgi:hypothetical protein
LSLGSKFRELFGTAGSMEFRQTWRQKATPAGRWFWEHTASTPPIDDSEFTGWPTPDTNTGGDGPSQESRNGPRLQSVVTWATPSFRDHKGHTITDSHPDGFNATLSNQVLGVTMAPWPTGTTL